MDDMNNQAVPATDAPEAAPEVSEEASVEAPATPEMPVEGEAAA